MTIADGGRDDDARGPLGVRGLAAVQLLSANNPRQTSVLAWCTRWTLAVVRVADKGARRSQRMRITLVVQPSNFAPGTSAPEAVSSSRVVSEYSVFALSANVFPSRLT